MRAARYAITYAKATLVIEHACAQVYNSLTALGPCYLIYFTTLILSHFVTCSYMHFLFLMIAYAFKIFKSNKVLEIEEPLYLASTPW